MFTDELTIEAAAGNGGDGVVRWIRYAHRPKGGPGGGNGGRGGDLYIRAVRDVTILASYAGNPSFQAEHGRPGSGMRRHGKDGDDLHINVPVGSRVTNLRDGIAHTLHEEGDTALILKGGIGGFGNDHFKSATNRAPEEATRGAKGERAALHIEVSLVADVGLIGLPNAGKSSLLNALTNATSRVGAYPFTTTEPHLGTLGRLVIADIPGLIEGASNGKGMGHTFLRHIAKTRLLLHCVSLEHLATGSMADLCDAYHTVRRELVTFEEELSQKPEWIVLTKRDLVTEAAVAEAKRELSTIRDHIFTVTLAEETDVTDIARALRALSEES